MNALALIETVERAGGRPYLLRGRTKGSRVVLGLTQLSSSGSMVIDIGGGTSDFAVISAGEVIAQESLNWLVMFRSSHYSISQRQSHILVGKRSAESLKEGGHVCSSLTGRRK